MAINVNIFIEMLLHIFQILDIEILRPELGEGN